MNVVIMVKQKCLHCYIPIRDKVCPEMGKCELFRLVVKLFITKSVINVNGLFQKSELLSAHYGTILLYYVVISS